MLLSATLAFLCSPVWFLPVTFKTKRVKSQPKMGHYYYLHGIDPEPTFVSYRTMLSHSAPFLQAVMCSQILPILVFSPSCGGELRAGGCYSYLWSAWMEAGCQESLPVSPLCSPHQAPSPRALQRARWTHPSGRWRPSGCPSRLTPQCGSS